nr:MBL fold metallo-hydrolase [Bacilli bacterium]
MLTNKAFVLNSIGTNTYVVYEESKQAFLIDPSYPDLTPVKAFCDAMHLHIIAIINTHAHFDHVAGNASAKQLFDVPLYCHEADLPLLRAAPQKVKQYFGNEIHHVEPDLFLTKGMKLPLGQHTFSVLETPGHSPGCVCLYAQEEGILFSGDTLFAGTIGRTDFPESDPSKMLHSLQHVLYPLPDSVQIYPGHDVDSTIGEERMCNPYFHFA